MQTFSQNITCALNLAMTDDDVIVTYHLVNSLPYQVIMPRAATLTTGLNNNHLQLSGPKRYACTQDQNPDIRDGVIINPGSAISTTLSLFDTCYFVKKLAAPGRYTLTMNNFLNVKIASSSDLLLENKIYDNTGYTHLLCRTIFDILPGMDHVNLERGSDL